MSETESAFTVIKKSYYEREGAEEYQNYVDPLTKITAKDQLEEFELKNKN